MHAIHSALHSFLVVFFMLSICIFSPVNPLQFLQHSTEFLLQYLLKSKLDYFFREALFFFFFLVGLSVILHFWSVQRNNYYCTSSDSCYSRPKVVNLQEPKWLFVSEAILPFTAPAYHLCIKLLNTVSCESTIIKNDYLWFPALKPAFVLTPLLFFCTDNYPYLQLMVAL